MRMLRPLVSLACLCLLSLVAATPAVFAADAVKIKFEAQIVEGAIALKDDVQWSITPADQSGTPAYFPDQTQTEFGAFVLDKRASDAPAPERAYAIFPHVLDAHIDALNYEVGRTGPDDLKPLAENNWTKPFVAGVIDVKSTVTESADEVADRIRQVMEYVPAERPKLVPARAPLRGAGGNYNPGHGAER